MDLISRSELKDKLDRGDVFQLAMVLEDWHFQAMHIPGSVHVPAARITKSGFNLQEEIVVYCATEACSASLIAYQRLRAKGFQRVRRYVGGVADWYRAGLPVVGRLAEAVVSAA